MAKFLTYRRWSYALHLFRRWLSNKFSAIKIDLTTVEEKIDEVDEKVEGVSDQIGDLNDIIESINGDTVDNIVNLYLDDEAEQIENIIGDWSNE